jgi:TIR domain-containing protein
VWYDEFSLKVGYSLRKSIDHGLAHSRFGVVILSKHFFEKHWPEQELNGLATREVGGKKVILPVWHGVGFEEVRQYSPTLADRIAVKTSVGLDKVIVELLKAMD